MAARLTLLGSAALMEDGAEIPLPVDRRGCLLAYLAVEAGWVNRERLALLFWPDADEPTSKRNFRQLLLRTRRLRPAEDLEVTPEAVRWPVLSDVAQFRAALADGDAQAAVAVYGGTLLGDFVVHDVGGFDAWLDGERDRLRLAFQDAGLALARDHLASGRYDGAARLLETLHASDPLAEDVLYAYVQALYLAGRRDAALAAYARFETQLYDELALEPLDATRELAASVRAGAALEVLQPVKDQRRVSLSPSKLAGRDSTRHALLAADTPVVLLHGEPGIGKSSLLSEALPDALLAKATDGLEKLPYHPLVDLIRARPEFASDLGPYLEDIVRLVPEIAPSVNPPPMDADSAKARVVEAIARFVTTAGRTIVIDDLQWADQATLETIIYLAGRGLRVYGAYRTAEVGPDLRRSLAALRSKGRLTEVAVEPVDEAAVTTLLADLMGRDEGPPAFSRRLWRQTGGNPMFVLETLRSLFESGKLRSDASGWHTDVDSVTIDYSEISVPDVIQEVIERRLEHLSGEATRLLEALALARTRLHQNTLASVTGLSPRAVAEALDEAQSSSFVTGMVVRHDLLREVIDARVPTARRRLLNGLIAAAVEDDADPAIVAEHWLAAGEYERAVAAWSRKVGQLRTRGVQPAATEMLESALRRLPDWVDTVDLKLDHAMVLRDIGDLEASRARLKDLQALDDLDPVQRLKVNLAEAWLDYYAGSFKTSAAKVEDMLVAEPKAQIDEHLAVDIAMMRASLAKEFGNLDEAKGLLEPVSEALRKGPPSAELINVLTSLATILDQQGDNDAALDVHTEALELAKRLASPYLQMTCSLNLVYCLADLGRLDDAIAVGETALAMGDYDVAVVLRNNLAATLVEAGRYEEALAHCEILATLDAVPHIQVLSFGRIAECLFLLGRADEAHRKLQAALDSMGGLEFAPAIAKIATVTLAHGSDAQVLSLAELTEDFEPRGLGTYYTDKLRDALSARAASRTLPTAWWTRFAQPLSAE